MGKLRINVMLDQPMLDTIDKWRQDNARFGDVPNRSQAIRNLLALGLRAHAGGKGGGDEPAF